MSRRIIVMVLALACIALPAALALLALMVGAIDADTFNTLMRGSHDR